MKHQESSTLLRVARSPLLGAARRALLAGIVLLSASHAWALQGGAGTSATRTGGASSSGGNAPLNAPEINPALVVSAVVLLVGGLLILTSRRRPTKA